jgi:hypothetical protein
VARARLAGLSPSWAATDLGQALVAAASALEDAGDSKEDAGPIPRRVVLVTDLQQGSRLDALNAFEWPSDVELELKVVSDPRSNAGLQWLAESPADQGEAKGLRVRVSNDAGSTRETFSLAWIDERGKADGPPVSVYVPPGESRVARVPAPDPKRSVPRRLVLEGDEQAFDNTLYAAAVPRDESTLLFLGNDAADDPAGLLYYLDRVAPATPGRVVKVVRVAPTAPLTREPDRATALAVVASETAPGNIARLRDYARGGGTVLLVLTAPGPTATLAGLAGVTAITVDEAPGGRDMLLSEIAFDHPLFAPLAGPQFNDFTKIRFWKHRRIDADAIIGSRVLARFDNGDAAVIEARVGKGRLVVFASGWTPADSQLARSSKFVPLMAGLLQGRDPRPTVEADLRVFDRVPLPAPAEGSTPVVVRKPDGTVVRPGAGEKFFTATDLPGVYALEAGNGDGPRPFAVNLDPAESKTAPLPDGTLEQMGCRLAAGPTRKAADRERRRQLHNTELEGRQKLWQPLILIVVVILIVETWLAGRLTRNRTARVEATAV